MRCGASLASKPPQTGPQPLGPGRLITQAQRRSQERESAHSKPEKQGVVAVVIESLGPLWDALPWIVSAMYIYIMPMQFQTQAAVEEHGELMRYSAQAVQGEFLSSVVLPIACAALLAWIIMDVGYNRAAKWWIVSFAFPPLAIVYLYKGRG